MSISTFRVFNAYLIIHFSFIGAVGRISQCGVNNFLSNYVILFDLYHLYLVSGTDYLHRYFFHNRSFFKRGLMTIISLGSSLTVYILDITEVCGRRLPSKIWRGPLVPPRLEVGNKKKKKCNQGGNKKMHAIMSCYCWHRNQQRFAKPLVYQCLNMRWFGISLAPNLSTYLKFLYKYRGLHFQSQLF